MECAEFYAEISYLGKDNFTIFDRFSYAVGFAQAYIPVGEKYEHPSVSFKLYRNEKKTLTIHIESSENKYVFIIKIKDIKKNKVCVHFGDVRDCVDERVAWTRLPKEW